MILYNIKVGKRRTTVSLLCYTRSESSIITIQNQKGTTDVKKKIKLFRNEQEKIEKMKE